MPLPLLGQLTMHEEVKKALVDVAQHNWNLSISIKEEQQINNWLLNHCIHLSLNLLNLLLYVIVDM
jgi:hypothetical protein